MTQSAATNETDRRVGDLIRLAVVDSVDLAAGRCIVTVGDLSSPPVPWLVPRAGATRAWSPPSVGEQVLFLCPDGELGLGVAIGGVFSDHNPAPDDQDRQTTVFEDGASFRYDPATHVLDVSLPATGVLNLTADGGLTVNAVGGVTLVGDVSINGELSATGRISSDVDVVANGIELTSHRHSGVQGGGSTSGGPVA